MSCTFYVECGLHVPALLWWDFRSHYRLDASGVRAFALERGSTTSDRLLKLENLMYIYSDLECKVAELI